MNKKFFFLLTGIFCLYSFRNIIQKKFFSAVNRNNIIEKTEEPQYYLINVLDKKEFDDAHITGSIHVPFLKVRGFLNSIVNKDIPIIFYCSNYYCTASDAAAKIAIEKGFNNVFVYKGGMAEWYQASLENNIFKYEGKAEEEYLQIVILPPDEILDVQLDIIDEENIQEQGFKIISINNLQNFLKEGIIIK